MYDKWRHWQLLTIELIYLILNYHILIRNNLGILFLKPTYYGASEASGVSY